MENPIGYDFQLCGDEVVKEYECFICLSLIKDAVDLPCTHIMCKLCLNHYENTSIGRSICPYCKQSYDQTKKHENKALDRIIQTSLKVKCKQETNGCSWTGCIIDYEDHYERCGSYPVNCRNNGCSKVMKRNEVKAHIQNDCDYEKILCVYHEFGCRNKIRRMDSEQHNKEATQLHMFLMMKNQVHLSTKNQQLEEKVKIMSIKLNESKDKITNLEVVVKGSINENKKQNKRLKELNDALKAKINTISHLETFSKCVAALHQILSRDIFKTIEPRFGVLFQEDYEKNEDVNDWLKFVKEFEDKIKGCDVECLSTLADSLSNYKMTGIPTSYEDRYEQLQLSMSTGVSYLYNSSRFFKLNSFSQDTIYIEWFTKIDSFEKELDRETRWIRLSMYAAAFIEEGCFHVCLRTVKTYSQCFLLHRKTGNKMMKLKKVRRHYLDRRQYSARNSIILMFTE